MTNNNIPQRPSRPSRSSASNSSQEGTPINHTANMQKGQRANMNNANVQNNVENLNLSPEEQVMLLLQKKRKKRNKIFLILLISILASAVIGVGVYYIATGRISSKVTELEANVVTLETQLQDTKDERDRKVAELLQAIEDTTVKELVPTTSLQRVEGSEVPELWLLEGDFIAPNPLELPTTTNSVNNSFIQIGDIYTFRPTEKWVLVSQGSTYELSHPQRIWGKIRALTARENIEAVNMKQTIQDFFIGYPATTITYRKVYFDTSVIGMMGRAQVNVKYNISDPQVENGTIEQNKDIVINVGFTQIGEYTLSFLFIYDVEGGYSSQELIDSFLKSCSVGQNGQFLKLE